MTKKFKVLFDQYKSTRMGTGSRYRTYLRMVKNARSFNDWVIVYQLGDNLYQYEALQNMKAKVLKGKTSSDVQKNILKLFEIVTDEDERNEILKAFLLKYHSHDDLCFASDFSLGLVVESSDLSVDEIVEIIDAQEKRLLKMAC